MGLDGYISSIKDEKVVEARALQTAAGRANLHKALLEGIEHIQWALASNCQITHVFVHEKQTDHQCINLLREKNIPLYVTSEGVLKKITDSSYLIPFVGVAKFTEHQTKKAADLLVVLDGVADFGNIGTIVRTAAAFGIREFISTEESPDFFYKKTIDASRGTVFSSHLQRFNSRKILIDYLRARGYQIAVATLRDSVMQPFASLEPKPIALVFGNETDGVSDEITQKADIKIQIPMSGAVESLNVGVAAGISLYEMKIKWILMMLIKKIQESLGRHLYCASRWVRLVFDAKLKEVCSYNADQVIMMMILKCDKQSTAQKLAHDAAISPTTDINALLSPLIKQNIISKEQDTVRLTEKGEELVSKLWTVHELAENIAFENISQDEKDTFVKTIEKIYKNCEKIVPFE